jgi:hypothetical protein
MGMSSDESLGKGENADPVKASATESADTPNDKPQVGDGNLPIVEAPKLAAGEAAVPSGADGLDEELKIAAAETIVPSDVEAANQPAAAPQPRLSRFALLAATIALAAAIGSFLGSLTASEMARQSPAAATMAGAAAGNVSQAVKLQLAELAAIKSNLDNASRSANAQFAKIVDRLDRVEHAQTDPAKLAQIADAVDRIDKRNAAATDITGSIAAGSSPAAEPKLPVVDGWIVQDVQAGRALVASRYGGEFEVAPGSVLPGLGRVETVKRQDGQWVVVTARGLITSGH